MNWTLQLLFWLSGGGVFAWALFDPRFRDIEGFLVSTFALALSAGAALIVLGYSIHRRFKRSALWLALALVGQAVALQMIKAGHGGEYQHYVRPLARLFTETHPLLLLYIALQSAIVFAALASRRAEIGTALRRTFKLRQLLAIGVVFSLFSAALSRYLSVYVSELLFATFIQFVNLGNIVLLVWDLPEDTLNSLKTKFDNFLGRPESGTDGPARLDRFAVILAIWVTALSAILCLYSYERFPHIPDEAAYLYHAQYFAEGMITMPAPGVAEAFDVELMHFDGDRWYSAQLPGWPAMLAVGVLLGIPWLINPVLAGLNMLLTYLLIQDIYNRRIARIVLMLLAVSPWYVFMAMNFMPHTFTLTCALGAAVAVTLARRYDKALWGWVAGFFTGFVSLIRPLEALAVAGLLGVWSVGIGGRRLKYQAVAGLVLGSIIVGSLGLYYNNLITGDPSRFPFMNYTDKYFGPGTNSLGFGPERGLGWPTLDPFPGHGPIDVLINAGLNIFSINIELFGWSTGSLLLIAVVLFSGAMKRSDYLMLAVIASIIGVHTFYWFSGGPDFGARYWYLVVVPCAALSVRGIQYLVDNSSSISPSGAKSDVKVLAGVLALCLLTLVNYVPWRAIDKYHHFRGIRPDIRYLAEDYDFNNGLVLVRGNRHVDYASAAVYNPVNFEGDSPIYAWDRTPEVRSRLLKSYPHRKIWIVNGPTITKKSFEVVSGPFSASELLARKEETQAL